jgi:hypothetical protein
MMICPELTKAFSEKVWDILSDQDAGSALTDLQSLEPWIEKGSDGVIRAVDRGQSMNVICQASEIKTTPSCIQSILVFDLMNRLWETEPSHREYGYEDYLFTDQFQPDLPDSLSPASFG